MIQLDADKVNVPISVPFKDSHPAHGWPVCNEVNLATLLEVLGAAELGLLTISSGGFVPFRNPADSIPSFDKLKEKLNIDRININIEKLLDRDIELDIEQYIKFYSYVVEYQYHTVLLDFDIFTQDLSYIARKVKAAKNIDVVNEVTVDDVKASMIESGREGNLPGGLGRASDEIKNAIINHPRFAECVNLYQQMKELAQ